MIVISGALVVVALVLLVLGVTGPDITRVYGSIVVSLVSLVFLVLGIVQRRGEVLPGSDDGTGRARSDGTAPASSEDPDEPVTDDPVTDDPVTDEPVTDDSATDDPATGAPASDDPATPVPGAVVAGAGAQGSTDALGTVLVVANRPRYHVPGCRYLAGKQTEEASVLEAREAGFTACGVCKPDDALAPSGTRGTEQARTAAETRVPEPGGDGQLAEVAPDGATSRPEPWPADAARSGSRPVDPRVAGVPGTDADMPQASPPPAEQVVVIPDRNRYHRPDCRHVRGFPGAETVTTAAAAQQGYTACGVCRP